MALGTRSSHDLRKRQIFNLVINGRRAAPRPAFAARPLTEMYARRPNVREMPRPMPLVSDAHNASLPVIDRGRIQNRIVGPWTWVRGDRAWHPAHLRPTIREHGKSSIWSSTVGTRCAASGFRRTFADGNVCQTPGRRGDAASRAADFGRAQRVPTDIVCHAESMTRFSGPWPLMPTRPYHSRRRALVERLDMGDQIMHLPTPWPILGLLHQTGFHRIVPHVVLLLAHMLVRSHACMKHPALPLHLRSFQSLGITTFPERDPSLHVHAVADLLRAAEEMEMVRHGHIPADQPRLGLMQPDVMQGLHDIGLRHPPTPILRTNRAEQDQRHVR